MAKRANDSGSNVKYTKQGSDIIFTIEGNNREYTIGLVNPEQVAILGPDLNELIWAVERAWRGKS